MTINVKMNSAEYEVFIERGGLSRLADFIDIKNRRVMVITDNGVPEEYLQTVMEQLEDGIFKVVAQGEGAKSFEVFSDLCRDLLEASFSRRDLIIALGGGVIGDLAGFVAASYMRGIDFVNIPTTTLSQIDSSIGGKVGINLDGVKNIVGSFYQPRAVIVDSDTLKTLPLRHFNNGLYEAVKSGLIYNAELFSLFEAENLDIDKIVHLSLCVKRDVVMQDEKENGLRKILNFGHTIGHAIESACGLIGLLHGEAVGFGMLPMLDGDDLRARVSAVLDTLTLPSELHYDKDKAISAMSHDKKSTGKFVTAVRVSEIGTAYLKEYEKSELYDMLP